MEAIVWGLRVISIEERIEEVIGLLANGEHYLNKHDVGYRRHNSLSQVTLYWKFQRKGVKESLSQLCIHN